MTVDDGIGRSRTFRVPQLILSEFYTQPVYTNINSDENSNSGHNIETVVEVENPLAAKKTRTAKFTLSVGAGPAADLRKVGEQTVVLDSGSSRRLYFPWSLSSQEPQYVELVMTVAGGGSSEMGTWYSPLGRPLPTEIAYAAGTAPGGSGANAHDIQIAKMAEFTDLVLSTDHSTLYVPIGGDGNVEVEVFNPQEKRLGKTEQTVNTTATKGPVTEIFEGTEWVEVPVEVPADTEYLVVHVKQERGLLWAIGKGAVGGLVALGELAVDLVGSKDRARRKERSPAVEADPYALEYEHIAVAEVSGYPQSADLRGFAREVAADPASEHEESTSQEALLEIISTAADLTDATAGVLLTAISVGQSIADEVNDELDDAFGVRIGFDELEVPNGKQVGKLSVYDYGTDDPSIGRATPQLTRHRTVDLQTTGVTGGKANVTIDYSNTTQANIEALDLVYGKNGKWKLADSIDTNQDEKTVSGSIPAADLTETPVAVVTRPNREKSGNSGFNPDNFPDWLPMAGGAGALGLGAGAYGYLKNGSNEQGEDGR